MKKAVWLRNVIVLVLVVIILFAINSFAEDSHTKIESKNMPAEVIETIPDFRAF